jgi:hypothetical protein
VVVTNSAGEELTTGLMSEGGTLNHPDSLYCRDTGIRLGANHTRRLLPGARPPLGVIITDDGISLSLVENLTIGSARGLSLRMEDPTDAMSRHHARLELRAWSVIGHDLGSTNGTWVCSTGSNGWEPILPGAPRELKSGDRLGLGSRVLTLRLHR